jgi:hypothetical protein
MKYNSTNSQKNKAQTKSPRICCLAMTASCLACAKNMTPNEYCLLHPQTAGCDQYLQSRIVLMLAVLGLIFWLHYSF